MFITTCKEEGTQSWSCSGITAELCDVYPDWVTNKVYYYYRGLCICGFFFVNFTKSISQLFSGENICMMSVSIKILNFEKVLGPNRWTSILDILNLNGIRWLWGGLLIFLHQEPFNQLNNHNSSHILLDSVLREASCANCWRHLWPKKGVRVIKKTARMISSVKDIHSWSVSLQKSMYNNKKNVKSSGTKVLGISLKPRERVQSRSCVGRYRKVRA